jgi:hypothetical protein
VSPRSYLSAEQQKDEVTHGSVLRRKRLARQWHARGQGFKSPQLHQAQRISRSPAQGRLPETCQSLTDRVGKNTMSADRFRYFRTHGASVIVRTFSTGLQGRPCGRPPPAATLAPATTPRGLGHQPHLHIRLATADTWDGDALGDVRRAGHITHYNNVGRVRRLGH